MNRMPDGPAWRLCCLRRTTSTFFFWREPHHSCRQLSVSYCWLWSVGYLIGRVPIIYNNTRMTMGIYADSLRISFLFAHNCHVFAHIVVCSHYVRTKKLRA